MTFYKYAVFCILILTATHGYAKIYVIAHPDFKTQHGELPSETVKAIYLGKKRSLDGRHQIKLLQPIDAETQTTFYTDVVRKTDAQFSAYWSRLLFTGKGIPPIPVKNQKEMVELILSNKKYIGFIEADSAPENVSILYSH